MIADGTADPVRLAADLLIEAEHGTDSSVVLITTSSDLADATDAELVAQLADLPDVRATAARSALGANGGCVLVDSLDEAVAIANRYAPEHLQVAVDDDDVDRVVAALQNAGEILVGQNTPFSAANFVIGCPASLADERIRARFVRHHRQRVPEADGRRQGRCAGARPHGTVGHRPRRSRRFSRSRGRTPSAEVTHGAYARGVTSILLVEDDERISEPLVRVLISEGFAVTHVDAARTHSAAVELSRPDLVLLDLTLPDIDGLDVCRKLRAEVPDLPIVMLTARAEEMDVIVGLSAGADDYIAKPFRLAELIARVRARLRVVEQATRSTPMLEGAGLRVDRDARRTFIDDREVELTSKEFDLLALLMSRPGVTFTREQIMNQVWDEHWWGSTRTLDTHVSTLRKKIGDDSDPPSIVVTIRGVGFRFQG